MYINGMGSMCQIVLSAIVVESIVNLHCGGRRCQRTTSRGRERDDMTYTPWAEQTCRSRLLQEDHKQVMVVLLDRKLLPPNRRRLSPSCGSCEGSQSTIMRESTLWGGVDNLRWIRCWCDKKRKFERSGSVPFEVLN